ncbi:DUF58 domain-containing protein [Massilia yuzhufengensis]|uniref:Uncharacterized conserved protein, DUF58 family, contains vWF domain n=1 Tax=Massilia yuzhufengensis TaxID=1164594 RepID=A0A1I1T2P4_9BURK|nr:DUF58 domain-containing protein [Massilia yuzhufengensis]SFD49570.1 Uncharacterized conserved protein, DUF58 family, contains vWF domain [Massilia yuzhufengensis]
MTGGLRAWLRRSTGKWLPRGGTLDAGEVVLSQRRVFILPTRAGIGFALLLLVLLIGSINYTLGLGFALTFLALSCALVDMVFTYRNLAHLALQQGRVPAVFAGQEAQFELHIANRGKLARYGVWVDFGDVPEARHVTDIGERGSAAVLLGVPTAARGWLRPARVVLSTRFPLGLFRAWSYWRPAAQALVYPRPEEGAPPLPLAGNAAGSGRAGGNDDFAGVRSYQAGDSPRQLAWRQIARLDPALGGQLVTKHFEGGVGDELVLDFAALPANLDLEVRLSRMTRWVLDAEQRALPYAFRLGTIHYQAGAGAAHQAACLRALALHGLEEAP